MEYYLIVRGRKIFVDKKVYSGYWSLVNHRMMKLFGYCLNGERFKLRIQRIIIFFHVLVNQW